MGLGRKAFVARIGIGIAGVAATTALVGPLMASEPAPVHRAPAAPVSRAVADTGCMAVDANGVPLVDSQYEQRTGHAPC